MKKHFPLILSSLIISFCAGVLVVHAQNYTGYTPLAPLPGTFTGPQGSETTGLTTYLSGAIKLLIAIGGALSILMAIIGGTQYVAAGIAPSAKQDAKNRIANAFIGLTLILSSYLILYSINPKLVAFKLSLDSVTPPSFVILPEYIWGDDNEIRDILADGTSIRINKPNCPAIHAFNCTSVYGLHEAAITGLRTLYANCKQASLDGSCNITITGGTEYWLHRSHNDGKKVDLGQGNTRGLDYYIKRNGLSSVTSCGVPSDPHYQPDGPSGGTYVDEPNRDANGNIIPEGGRHWHVCYKS